MKWNRATVKAVAIVFVTVVATSFFVRWTFDHDGESSTLLGDDSPSAAATPAHPSGTSTAIPVESGDLDPVSGLPWILEEELPAEGRATLALIDRGGPFPYDKDGATFGNFEGLLPDHRRGYYHEYTVVTPGSRDRGARRIVTGDTGEFYWTEDHYESFEPIARREP